MATKTTWTGTATALFNQLGDNAGDRITKAKEWPKAPNKLSGRLRRIAHFLRKVRINIAFPERTAVNRAITISRASDDSAPNDDSPSGRPLFSGQEEGAPAEGQADWVRNLSSLSSLPSSAAEAEEFQAGSNDDTGDDTGARIVTAKSLDHNGNDDSDDSDDKMHPGSASVPFMITQDMKRRLRALRYADEAITQLTPADAHRICQQCGQPERPDGG